MHAVNGIWMATLVLTGCGMQSATAPNPEPEALYLEQRTDGDKHTHGMVADHGGLGNDHAADAAFTGDGHGVSGNGYAEDAAFSECLDGDPHSHPFPM